MIQKQTMKNRVKGIYSLLEIFSPTENLRITALEEADIIMNMGKKLNWTNNHGFNNDELEEIYNCWFERVPINECLESLLLDY